MIISLKKLITKNKFVRSYFGFFLNIYAIFYFLKIKLVLRLLSIKSAMRGQQSRKSDRVYILGSGPSINAISNWSEIGRHDSVGINFGLLHNFIPTKYFFETPASGSDERKKKLFELLKLRSKDMNKTEIFAPYLTDKKDRDQLKGLFKYFQFYVPLNFYAPNKNVYENFLRFHYFYKNNFIDFVGCGNSSIDKVLNYCLICGYKEIVILGVDSESSEYFYTDRNKVAPQFWPFIPNNLEHAGRSVHLTNDPEYPRFGLTTSESIIVLTKIADKLGASIIYGNAQTK